jgi:hypothetical protein
MAKSTDRKRIIVNQRGRFEVPSPRVLFPVKEGENLVQTEETDSITGYGSSSYCEVKATVWVLDDDA